MSNRAQNWAFNAGPEIHGAARLVLWKLADNANEYDIAYPSVDHLAAKCNLTRANVQRALRRLEDHGYIRKARPGGRISKAAARAARLPTTYLATEWELLITTPDPRLQIPPDQPDDDGAEVVDNSGQLGLEGPHNDAPEGAQGHRTARSGASHRAFRGIGAMPQPSLQPSCEPAVGSSLTIDPVLTDEEMLKILRVR